MTMEEYRSIEREALDNLQRFSTLGIDEDNIAFVMSRDVYLAASSETSRVFRVADYAENGAQAGIRSVYQGYDVYIISEESRSMFQPAIKGFRLEGVSYNHLSLGDLVLFETVDEDPHIYVKMRSEPLEFNDTGLTVCREYERVANGQVTFADRPQVRRWEWERQYDWTPMGGFYSQIAPLEIPAPDAFSRTFDSSVMDELRRYIDTRISGAQCAERSTSKRKKKAPPAKDWDERITPEDTKELDEFLNGLARKGTLESAM